jgi:hypothetical protein
MGHELTRFARRLLSDSDGQVVLFVILFALLLLSFMLVVPNVTQVTIEKMRAQTSADAGAYTTSLWLARALNLSANMNVGIRSMYQWMVVLTASEALALALDSIAATKPAASQMTFALFGQLDPHYTASVTYPLAIQKLAATVQWLSALQTDVGNSFWMAAQTLGTSQVAQNEGGGNPLSPNQGGTVLYSAGLTFFGSDSGMQVLNSMRQLAGELGADMPKPISDTTNVGTPFGTVTVDSATYNIKAVYGLPSNWATLVQKDSCFVSTGPNVSHKDRVWQFYDSSSKEDTAYKDFVYPFTNESLYVKGTYWIDNWLNQPDWTLRKSYDTTFIMPLSSVYFDSTFTTENFVDKTNTSLWLSDSSSYWGPPYYPTSGRLLSPRAQNLADMGYNVIVQQSYFTFSLSTTLAAESTNNQQGPVVHLRKIAVGVNLSAVSYAWRRGGATAPVGLHPSIGPQLFPQSSVASPSPMLAVARSIAYLAKNNPADSDYYFSPSWDVELTQLDSAGTAQISTNATFVSLGLGSLNLGSLYKYGMLP